MFKPTSEAFLLLRMCNVPGTPVPAVLGACIASSPPGSMTCMKGEFYAQLTSCKADSFQEAHDDIMKAVEFYPHLQFLKFFLDPQKSLEFSRAGTSEARSTVIRKTQFQK